MKIYKKLIGLWYRKDLNKVKKGLNNINNTYPDISDGLDELLDTLRNGGDVEQKTQDIKDRADRTERGAREVSAGIQGILKKARTVTLSSILFAVTAVGLGVDGCSYTNKPKKREVPCWVNYYSEIEHKGKWYLPEELPENAVPTKARYVIPKDTLYVNSEEYVKETSYENHQKIKELIEKIEKNSSLEDLKGYKTIRPEQLKELLEKLPYKTHYGSLKNKEINQKDLEKALDDSEYGIRGALK